MASATQVQPPSQIALASLAHVHPPSSAAGISYRVSPTPAAQPQNTRPPSPPRPPTHPPSAQPQNIFHTANPSQATPLPQPSNTPAQATITTSPPQTQALPREWTALWLRRPMLGVFFLVTLGLIAGIVAAKIISHKRHGICDVTESTKFVLTFAVGQSLWWTTFVAFIFQAFGLWYGAIIQALSDRQLFVELKRGRSSRNTILLDYNRHVGATRWIAAARNLHVTLSFNFLLVFLLSLFLASIAAHLFTPGTVVLTQEVSTRLDSAFAENGFTGNSDLIPVFDIVSSTQVYGGSLSGWVNSRYSFQNFSEPTSTSRAANGVNFLVNTTGYSSDLQCRPLTENEYQLEPSPGVWNFWATDHGCDYVDSELPATDDFTWYMQTFNNDTCIAASGWSRIFVLSAATWNHNNNLPSNITVLACNTSYYQTFGQLNISYTPTMSAGFLVNNFKPYGRPMLLEKPNNWYWNFETQINEPAIFDNTASTSAPDFGRVILAYSKKKSPHNYLDSHNVLEATTTIWTSTFAMMASTFLWQQADGGRVTGLMEDPAVRLLIVDPIADILLTVLSIIAVSTPWIAWYVYQYKSCQYEERSGLLSWAIMLHRSGLDGLVTDLRADNEAKTDGKAVEHAKQRREWKIWRWTIKMPWSIFKTTVREKSWRIEKWETPVDARIVEV